MRIATRCATLDQFVAQFRRFCDERSVFVCTLVTRPVGLETAFSIDLADGTPALRGIGRVLDASSTDANRFGRPGLHLGIQRLTADSERVFARLRAPEAGAPEAQADGAQTDVHVAPANEGLPPGENRTPGGELVLPANPLAGIGDRSLEGFVDCTLYEETGNFFPLDPSPDEPAEPTTPPPELVPIPRRPTPVPVPAVTAPSPMPEPPAPVQVSVPTPALPAPSPTPEPAKTLAPIAAPMPQELEGAPSQPAIELPPEDLLWTPPAPPPPPPRIAPPPVPVFAHSTHPVIDEPPVGTRRLPGWTKLRELPRAWQFGAAGALAAIVIVIVIIAASGSRKTGAGKSALPPPALAVAPRPTAASSPAPTPALAPEPAEPDETASGGTPVVGKGPCRFSVTTTPAGSIVQVDGDTLGPSPIVVAGPCQKRQLTISHQRYKPQTREVELMADKPQNLDVILQRPMHHLMIETVPNGAIVSIAGHPAGMSPTNVDIMGFTTLAVVITKPGYKPVSRQVYSKVPNDHLEVKLTR
jgi:hypothetical protein